jgi:hypothetical protein
MSYNWRQVGLSLAAGIGIGVLISSQAGRFTATIRDIGARLGNHESRSARKELVFTPGAIGEIMDQDGFRLSIHGFKISDGGNLSYYLFIPIASASANDEFERWLAPADFVVVRDVVKNARGEGVGRRAVVFFPNRDAQGEVAAVVWSDGRDLHSIESLSLYDALVFEKRVLAGLPNPPAPN